MTINLLHVSDIHFGSGESHGRINPETGLNIRFEDFVLALKKAVDYAIEKDFDVFLFSGDAYRTASPEPIYQKMFALELGRLSKAGIKTILVVGNHDQILRSTGSHSMSVFQSLDVPGVLIVDKPMLEIIDTRHGAMQLIGLPHVTRNNLMTLSKYADRTAAQIDETLVMHVRDILKGYYEQLDPEIPTVSTAHLSLDRAVAGIEAELLVGYTLTFPTELFVDERVDYVAMGHIHKYQIIRESDPAIVYAGSLERIDFGESKEDKGFVHVSLKRKSTSYEFISIDPRRFMTIDLDLREDENPTETLIKSIKSKISPGCVLRVRYRISQEKLVEISEKDVRRAAADCLSVRMTPEIVQPVSRGRLPQLTEEAVVTPIKALETYLDEVAPERKERLIERAKQVMASLEVEMHNGKPLDD